MADNFEDNDGREYDGGHQGPENIFEVESLSASGRGLTRRSGYSGHQTLLMNLPFVLMLGIAVLGIALSSFGINSLNLYWEVATPIYCLLCIFSGWPHAEQGSEQLRLIWTQILHWAAFLIAMYLVSSPNVRVVESNTAMGIDQMAILALGAFVAGVHARAWQICVVGALLAIAVPAIAWVERSALLVVLSLVLGGFVAATIWWARKALFHHDVKNAR